MSTLLRVTESGGDVGLVRDLPGVAPDLVRALVEAFEALTGGCAELSAELEAGIVHEHAFGKLIDATKVCDAYHERLPATKVNLTEAREVARSFLAEFTVPPVSGSPVPGQREPQRDAVQGVQELQELQTLQMSREQRA
jgi:hypothetical protein